MANLEVVAPWQVLSFTKEKPRAVRRVDPPMQFRWGGPSVFSFTPQPPAGSGPEVLPPDAGTGGDGIDGFVVRWLHGSQAWTGHEVFRDASVYPSNSPTMPVEVEGVRTSIFDLGVRVIEHEEYRQSGSVTIIYPTLEYRHEYLELEFALTSVLSRGVVPPADVPLPPPPPEIAQMPLLSATEDLSGPSFMGAAVVPMAPNNPAGVVDLGAFRTPISFTIGGADILMLAFSWNMSGQGSGVISFHFDDPELGGFGWDDDVNGIRWPWPDEGVDSTLYMNPAFKGNFVRTGGSAPGANLWPIHVYLNLTAILAEYEGPPPEVLRVRTTGQLFAGTTYNSGSLHYEFFKAPPLEAAWGWDIDVVNNQSLYPADKAGVISQTAPDEWDPFMVGQGEISVPPIPTSSDSNFQPYGYIEINLATKTVSFIP